MIDTTAPSGTPGNPGDFLRGIANLTYSTTATDVSSVQFQFSPASAGAWSNIGAADIAPPYEASWTTNLVADGPYDIRAVVTDSVGNVANELLPGLPKTVDNTAPSGSVTSPAPATFVSGSVNVTATATDGATPPASGVSAVRFEIKPFGAGAFTVFGTQTVPIVGSTYHAVRWPRARSPTAPPTCRSSSPTSPATRRRPRSRRSTSTTTPRSSRSTTRAPPSAPAST